MAETDCFDILNKMLRPVNEMKDARNRRVTACRSEIGIAFRNDAYFLLILGTSN